MPHQRGADAGAGAVARKPGEVFRPLLKVLGAPASRLTADVRARADALSDKPEDDPEKQALQAMVLQLLAQAEQRERTLEGLRHGTR